MRLLVGARVSLQPLTAEDREEFIALAKDSASLHRGLIFAPTDTAEFQTYLARFDGVHAVGFVVRVNATNRLAGLVNLNHIVRVPRPRGALGFGGFAATSGHGYVAEGVRLAVRYAREELGLRSLDAYVQPTNTASQKVITNAGFRQTEAREIIRIDGERREHERWTLDLENNGS